MYEDDGLISDAFAKGKYRLHQFNSAYQMGIGGKASLQIGIQQRHGKQSSLQDKRVTLIIHNLQNAPKQVMHGAIAMAFKWDATSKTLEVPLNENAKSSNLIRVNW
jgi:hypothetical protein